MTPPNPNDGLTGLLAALAKSVVAPTPELKQAWTDYAGTPFPEDRPRPEATSLTNLLALMLYYTKHDQNPEVAWSYENWRYVWGLREDPPPEK